MRYAVDTHILLWSILQSHKLSQDVLKAFEDADEIQASNVNFWEISLKYRLGKLDLGVLNPADILTAAKDSNFKIIDIDSHVMATLYKLPLGKHKDPFDRMLIWYSIQNNIPLISRDGLFGQYESEGLKLIQ